MSGMNDKEKSIFSQFLGELDVQPDGFAYCECPAKHLHTTSTGKHDCRLYFTGGAPTVFCLHASCVAALKQINWSIRSALGKRLAKSNFSSVGILSTHEKYSRELEERETTRLGVLARESFPAILAGFPWSPDQMYTDSPHALSNDPTDDWRLILSLFAPTDRIWIGDKRDSGGIQFAGHFCSAAQWMSKRDCPKGPLILPATLKPETYSRTKQDIANLPFLVVESDYLPKADFGAVTRWLCDAVGLSLRAVVDTAGRSLHAWFVRPDSGILRELGAVLPALQCDGALLRSTQPVRLPGCKRPEKNAYQSLLYLNREDVQ